MDCQDYKKWISRKFDDELDDRELDDRELGNRELGNRELQAAQARMLEEHLAGCDSCMQYQRDLESMRALFTDAETPVPSAGLRDRVLAATREENAGRNTFMMWARMVKRACAAALILAGLTIGSFYIGGSDTLHAVDTNKELHYEDLFQKGRLDSAELLEAMLKTSNPRKALEAYEVKAPEEETDLEKTDEGERRSP